MPTAPAQTTGTCQLGAATVDLDIGNVRARMYNRGDLFWIGGMTGGELRMAAATYSHWEFWPGPFDAQGNPPTDCAAYDRIYLVDRADLERLHATGEAGANARGRRHIGAPCCSYSSASRNALTNA